MPSAATTSNDLIGQDPEQVLGSVMDPTPDVKSNPFSQVWHKSVLEHCVQKSEHLTQLPVFKKYFSLHVLQAADVKHSLQLLAPAPA